MPMLSLAIVIAYYSMIDITSGRNRNTTPFPIRQGTDFMLNRIIILAVALILPSLGCFSQAEDIAPNRSGDDLIQFLRSNYRPNTTLGYRQAREHMFSDIDNEGGRVTCVYTGVEMSTSGIPNHTVMNTEHTWPQSKFNSRFPMKSDLHHLFPTLNPVNGARGNFPFAEIPDATTEKWYLSNVSETSLPAASIRDNYSEWTNGSFEPREDHKGNVARAMVYFWVVYGNDNISANWIDSQLATFAQWDRDDPIDAKEQARNVKIKAIQGNENPFILDPTLLQRVVTGSPAPAPHMNGPTPTDGGTNQPIQVRIACWNMQSDWNDRSRESDPDLLQQQMAAKTGIKLWGLSEVLDASTLAKFEAGAEDGEGSDFVAIMGRTGGRDSLAILYDSSVFEQIGQPIELETETRLTSGLRATLVLHLKGKKSGQEFLFGVNHLKRGGSQNPTRLQQAKNLNQWARSQTLPVVLVGDFNFDYDVQRGHLGLPHRDGGFDALVKDHIFQWVPTTNMVKTQADDRYNTMLDFIFVANAPFGWTGSAKVLRRTGDEAATTIDFDDDDRSSDHRPVSATFMLGSPLN